MFQHLDGVGGAVIIWSIFRHDRGTIWGRFWMAGILHKFFKAHLAIKHERVGSFQSSFGSEKVKTMWCDGGISLKWTVETYPNKHDLGRFSGWYCWWLKSQTTTWDVFETLGFQLPTSTGEFSPDFSHQRGPAVSIRQMDPTTLGWRRATVPMGCKLHYAGWGSWRCRTCTALKPNGWNLKITQLKRKVIWTKPPVLGSKC